MKIKDDSKEIATEVINTLSQIFIGVMTAISSGSDPYTAGAGTFFGQIAGLRSKLKINRVENFVLELGKYMESKNVSFGWENVNSEDFGDFFEELLSSIAKTNSKNKLDRFKRLLFSQIEKPADSDMASRYLVLTSVLDDGHILILNHFFMLERKLHSYRKSSEDLQTYANNLLANGHTASELESWFEYTHPEKHNKAESLASVIQFYQGKLDLIGEKRENLFNQFDEGELRYLTNDLKTRGLLMTNDGTMGSLRKGAIFGHHSISAFGTGYMEYVNEI